MPTPKHLLMKVTPKLGQGPETLQKSFNDQYFLQAQLIEETQDMVTRCFTPEMSEIINFDAMQAICFLVVTDQHIDLGNIELQNCLDLLGVHPVILEDTIKSLKKIYHLPKKIDLLTFIRDIGPLLLAKSQSWEFI